MSDHGLGYFPIAGPKNSSTSLKRNHVVSFYFHIFCFLCPQGQRIEPESMDGMVQLRHVEENHLTLSLSLDIFLMHLDQTILN